MPYGEKRIPIGRRNEQVTIQQALTADDGAGGQQVLRWKTVSEPWGKVEALDERQRESLIADQIQARHSYFVTIPYQPNITADLRMLLRGATMQIQTVTDDEGLGRRLKLYVTEMQD